MQQVHGLSACEPKVSITNDGGISATLKQSDFGGKLKKFELVIEKGEVDMLSLKMNEKNGPHKFQLQGKASFLSSSRFKRFVL